MKPVSIFMAGERRFTPFINHQIFSLDREAERRPPFGCQYPYREPFVVRCLIGRKDGVVKSIRLDVSVQVWHNRPCLQCHHRPYLRAVYPLTYTESFPRHHREHYSVCEDDPADLVSQTPRALYRHGIYSTSE